jgi:hypothetical protein
MARYGTSLYFAFCLVCAWCVTDIPVRAVEFYAVVERNGAVAFCLSKGSILFADRCEGTGRLTIVEPIKEGPVVWRSATGTVSLENITSSPQCALSRAKWDPKAEQVISTGRKISKADRTDLLKRLSHYYLKAADFVESDLTAFMLNLDNNSKEEIVFVASDLPRLAEQWERDKTTRPYEIAAGVLPNGTDIPTLFHSGHGDYTGGTDAIGTVNIKGIAPISPGTGEIALLANGWQDGGQSLIRYRSGTVQRIDTIEYTCN